MDINEYDVQGNTLLPATDVARTVYPFEGPKHHLSDVEKARAALEKLYADRGYQAVAVVIPPQKVHDGIVTIKVIEAKIGEVKISGEKYASEHEVERALPSVTVGSVPNFKDFNRDLVALNSQSADLQVTPQLKPGAKPDTIDVDLAVNDALPVHGGLEINNNYSQDTRPLRLQGNLAYNDLWGMGHSIAGYLDLAPQNTNDALVYLFTYSAPVPDSGIRLSLTGLKSDSNVTTVGSTGVIGKGESLTFTANVPLPTNNGYSQTLLASFAYKRFIDVVSVTGQKDSAPITYYPFSVAYNGSYHAGDDTIATSIAADFAFRELGSDPNAYDAKRYRALGNFIYLRGSASLTHDLPSGAQLYLDLDGQVANEPLISNEQFTAGGLGSVRGYLQAEALGDNGTHESLELRSPFLIKDSSVAQDIRLFAFTDAAQAWLLSPLPEQKNFFELVGSGLGISGKLKYFSFEGDWGRALFTNAATKANQDRFYFRVYSQF